MDDKDYLKLLKEKIRLRKLAFKILELPEGSGIKLIKKAYIRLAMKYHPDKKPEDKELEKQFKNIQNAYEFLISDKNRGRIKLEGDMENKAKVKTTKYNLDNEWGYYLWWKDKFH
jgi:DnaJ-class molecular chaperone